MDYTRSQAATVLGMKPRTVTQYVRREIIKAEKRGRDYFITQQEIDRFTRERRGRGRPAKQQAD